MSGGQQTITFNNVTTSSHSYYVAIKALNSSAENLTNLSSGATIAGDNVCVSDSGGEGGGALSVGNAPAYTVSTTTPLEVSLNLRDAIGAALDTQLTVTDGGTYSSSDVSYFNSLSDRQQYGDPSDRLWPV